MSDLDGPHASRGHVGGKEPVARERIDRRGHGLTMALERVQLRAANATAQVLDALVDVHKAKESCRVAPLEFATGRLVEVLGTARECSTDTPHLSVRQERQRSVFATFEQLGEGVLQERNAEATGGVGDDLGEELRLDATPIRWAGPAIASSSSAGVSGVTVSVREPSSGPNAG